MRREKKNKFWTKQNANHEFCSFAEHSSVIVANIAIASKRDMVMRYGKTIVAISTTMKTIATVNLVCIRVFYTKQLIVR